MRIRCGSLQAIVGWFFDMLQYVNAWFTYWEFQPDGGFVERTDARMCFFCYWDDESGDRVPDVPDGIRAMTEAMGGTIEIDEYK